MTYWDDIQRVATIDLPWDKLDGCNILITGATGLIGNCLVDVLMAHPNRSFFIYALGRNMKRMDQLYSKYKADKSFCMLEGDITVPLNTSHSFQFIIHAASGAGPIEFASHPVEVMKSNIIGLINLMEYGLGHDMKRLLFISSGEVYGEGDGRDFSEEYSGYVNPLLPRSCYPSSKRAAETLCSSYASEFNANIVIARPCHIYGPHFTDNDNRAFAQFIKNILHNEDIVMKSSGKQYRSWCYVVDCASALLHILLKGSSCQAYNVADRASNISVRELAELVAEIGGKKVIVDTPSSDEARGFNVVTKSVYSTEKLESLGWSVSGSIKDKMRLTIQERTDYERKRADFR